ncbi:MAG: hypothetical protein ACK4YO_02825, partial [Candidatus Altarchaeaceae archaeon]
MKIYSKLISKINYKILAIIPAVISILMIIILLINGIQLSFDFSGGILGELDMEISNEKIDEYKNALINNVENLKFKSDGKVTIIQTTSTDREKIVEITEKILKDVRTKDMFILNLDYKISYDVYERLMKRFQGIINISEEDNKTKIIIFADKLDENYTKKALLGYLNFNDDDYKFEKANLRIEQISSTLSANIRTQAIIAFVIAYILMSFVIFIAFRTLIPSIAIIAAATADILFALGS